MNTILLTHERELSKKTGTGQVVKSVLKDSCVKVIWKRKEPSPLLENQLTPENTLLVYPGGESEDCINFDQYENFIILDGTWQEANKIYNRSPYLKKFKKLSFSDHYTSKYRLRRNQKSSGLCTIESVIAIYQLKNDKHYEEQLNNAYNLFQSSF